MMFKLIIVTSIASMALGYLLKPFQELFKSIRKNTELYHYDILMFIITCSAVALYCNFSFLDYCLLFFAAQMVPMILGGSMGLCLLIYNRFFKRCSGNCK